MIQAGTCTVSTRLATGITTWCRRNKGTTAEEAGPWSGCGSAISGRPCSRAIGTELNLVNRLAEEMKERGVTVQFMSPMVCMCSTMFRIDAQHLAWSLDNLVAGHVVNRIRVPENVATPARTALDRMLAIAR